jgi:hypothetical protein
MQSLETLGETEEAQTPTEAPEAGKAKAAGWKEKYEKMKMLKL